MALGKLLYHFGDVYVNVYQMPRDIVKLRKVAGSMVISIPQTVLMELQIHDGDRLLIEALTPYRLMITKEEQTMPNAQRVELELDVLRARKIALELDRESKEWQHNNDMEIEQALRDESIFTLTMMERNRELADLEVDIAKKRLEIFEIQGALV